MKRQDLIELGWDNDSWWNILRCVLACPIGGVALTAYELSLYVDRFSATFPHNWEWGIPTVVSIGAVVIALGIAQVWVLEKVTFMFAYLLFGRRYVKKVVKEAKADAARAKSLSAKNAELVEQKALLEQRLARMESVEYRVDPAALVRVEAQADSDDIDSEKLITATNREE